MITSYGVLCSVGTWEGKDGVLKLAEHHNKDGGKVISSQGRGFGGIRSEAKKVMSSLM